LNNKYFRVPTFGVLIAVLFLFSADVLAGTTGSAEFQNFYDTLVGWLTGYLGRIIAIAFLLYGAGRGVMAGSVAAAVPTVAIALIMMIGPTVIEAIITATIPV